MTLIRLVPVEVKCRSCYRVIEADMRKSGEPVVTNWKVCEDCKSD